MVGVLQFNGPRVAQGEILLLVLLGVLLNIPNNVLLFLVLANLLGLL